MTINVVSLLRGLTGVEEMMIGGWDGDYLRVEGFELYPTLFF
jgi:hypothetical protein